MKTRSTILMLIIFTLIVSCSKVTERFTHQPENPHPGEEISIAYNPEGTKLERADDITMLAYCFPRGIPVVQEINMEKSSGAWHGSFYTADTTLTVYIIFSSAKKLDDNGQLGYHIPLFNDENNLVKGGMARQAEVASSGGSYPLQLERDKEKAKVYYEKEFELYPAQNQNWEIVNSYWYVLYALNKDSAEKIIRDRLEELSQKEVKTAEELSSLINWYQRFDEKEQVDVFKNELLILEPKGERAEWEQYNECAHERSLEKRRELIVDFVSDFPDSELAERLHSGVLNFYMQNGQYKEVESYLNDFVDDPGSAILNSIAWEMVSEDTIPEQAIRFAEMAMQKARQEAATSEKPVDYTQKQWHDMQNYSLGNIIDTYGYAMYRTGKVEESIPFFEEAVELNQRMNQDILLRYCHALFEAGQTGKAYAELGAMLNTDPNNQEIRDFFQKVYIAHNGSEAGLEAFFEEAEMEYALNKKEELIEQMLDKPAPGFTLLDLDSNAVSLADFEGKIVILDFWATWCGPCVASFPAMQIAVDKYKEDDMVKFLFIDTWENGKGADKEVRDFITDHNYTFHVLRDIENSVVTAYGVSGIPTKFIIGPEGNIRFQNKGWGGNDTKLVDELDMMIDMLR